jgi:hypothetical protein
MWNRGKGAKNPLAGTVQEKIGAPRQSHPPTVPEEKSDLDLLLQKVNSCSPITHGYLAPHPKARQARLCFQQVAPDSTSLWKS